MSDLVGNPEDRFSHNEALFICNFQNLSFKTKISISRTCSFQPQNYLCCLSYDEGTILEKKIKNKQINEVEMHLKFVVITFTHVFLVL